MNFDEVREYLPGDEVRAIDWNVTARAGRPFVKKFVEERELTLMLMVDVSASGDFGSGEQSKRELAAEIASVLAFSAMRNSDKVGLLLFTDKRGTLRSAAQRARHVLRIVREVLGFEPRGAAPIWRTRWSFVNDGKSTAARSSFCSRISKRRRSIEAMADLPSRVAPDESASRSRALCRSKIRANAVLPELGIIAIEDAETGEMIEIDTANRLCARGSAKSLLQRAQQLQEIFNREAIDSLHLSADRPYVADLHGLL